MLCIWLTCICKIIYNYNSGNRTRHLICLINYYCFRFKKKKKNPNYPNNRFLLLWIHFSIFLTKNKLHFVPFIAYKTFVHFLERIS